MNIKLIEIELAGVKGAVTKLFMEQHLKIPVAGKAKLNCYLVSDPETHEAFIIDPGEDAQTIINESEGFKIKGLIGTHLHYEHLSAFPEICKKLNIPIYLHENGLNFFEKDIKRLINNEDFKFIRPIKHNEKLTLRFGIFYLKVIHTPGHSPGSICLYNNKEGIIFTGDTFFLSFNKNEQFKGSNIIDGKESLKKLLALPKETKIFPAHGPPSTIGKPLSNWNNNNILEI